MINPTALIRSEKVSFFFNDTATTEIYTLSLHDALPIFGRKNGPGFTALFSVSAPCVVASIRSTISAKRHQHRGAFHSHRRDCGEHAPRRLVCLVHPLQPAEG